MVHINCSWAKGADLPQSSFHLFNILLHHPASNILSLAQPETRAFQMCDIITITQYQLEV
jgi:hypothetical protein